MSKIDKLTPKQEKGLTEWREHCLNIGRDTSPINKDLTEKSWKKFYQILGKKEPVFWYCQSPLQAQIVINIFPEIVKIFEITDKGANIGDNIRANINNTKLEKIETYSWCQHDINWIAYHKYFEKYGLLPYDENFKIFDIWYDLACSCGWCYTFKNIVFVCEKPNKLELNERGQLHKDGGMALEYSDGYGLHMLNGIAVPKYLAETSSELLDIEFFKKEQNADVKTEFVRKYGVDRLLTLGNKIDDWKNHNQEWWKKSEYELWDLGSLFNLDHAYHLRMKNLSVDGVFHVEAVSPQSDTLPKAIQYRLKGKNDTLTNIK